MLRRWGDTVHPAEYGYSDFGERTSLKTFRASSDWNLGVTDFFGIVDFADFASYGFSGFSRNGITFCGWIAVLRSQVAAVSAGGDRDRDSGHAAVVGIRPKLVARFLTTLAS